MADTILSFADNVKANVDYSEFKKDIAAAVNQFNRQRREPASAWERFSKLSSAIICASIPMS